MEKKKNKLTAEIKKQIKEAAQKLPPAPLLDAEGEPSFRSVKKKVLGEDLPKDLAGDQEIDPKKIYTLRSKEMVMMNHEAQLIAYYKKYGQHGIDEYCKIINGFKTKIDLLEHMQSNNLKIVN